MATDRFVVLCLSCVMVLFATGLAFGQQSTASPPATKAPAKKAPPAQTATPPKSDAGAPDPSSDKSDKQEPQSATLDPDAALQIAVQQAANDGATLIKNLEAYLVRYPDSPRRAAIYRALMESEMRLHNQKEALDYAERVIVLQPEDIQTMYTAITILEKMPDDASQIRALDYDTRLIEQVAKANPDSRPPQMTLDDWQAGRNKFTMQLYIVRGRIDRHLHKDDDAVKDLTTGFRIQPSAEAALNLGEIAEEQKHADEAVRQYALAFILNESQMEKTIMLQTEILCACAWEISGGLRTIPAPDSETFFLPRTTRAAKSPRQSGQISQTPPSITKVSPIHFNSVCGKWTGKTP